MKALFSVVLFSLALSAISVSCSDLSKGKYLEAIKGMNVSLDSLDKALLDNKIDTLPQLITSTMMLELRIKNNYEADTIDLEFGKKMDEFKKARRSLKPLGSTYSRMRTGIIEEREILSKLEKDISAGNGNRKKYGEYVDFEKNKLDQLRKLLSAYIAQKNNSLERLGRIYPELNAFSLQLVEKKNEKKK